MSPLRWPDSGFKDGFAYVEVGGEEERLLELGRWVLGVHRRDLGHVDGGDLQEKAIELGLLEWVDVTEACGEFCFCQEWDDFPQRCLRRASFQEVAR